MATNKTLKIGLIIGSQRTVRIAPQVANFILETLRAHTQTKSPAVTLDCIDIAEYKLPIFDEPVIPQHINNEDGYHHEHTRVWSRRIAAQDAFIFLSAQRNWGIPAELKNSIDYLYHEWAGKPAFLITYGGHGGKQCADQLRTVLSSMRMRIIKPQVNMAFPDADFRTKAFKGQPLGLDTANDDGPWAAHRKEFEAAFDELVEQLTT